VQYQYQIKFNQVYISGPQIAEVDGETRNLYPHEARLRSLTYAAGVFIDINCKQYAIDGNQKVIEDEPPVLDQDHDLIHLCYLPIMVKSVHCILKSQEGRTDRDLTQVGECVFDQGGYFVINGSEKVIIAQERISNNHVYVFKKQQPSKFEWVCETRSHVSSGSRPTSTMYLQMYNKGQRGNIDGRQLRCTIPYIRMEVPIIIVFRALGFEADRDIMEHIVYDFKDVDMMARLRPSFDDASIVQQKTVALDYIGKRGSATYSLRSERVQYARDILQKELLPHVGTEANNETKKAFFVGYIVHKILMCSLGRLHEDDRDHLGKKRLDLAGPLMGGLFRILFKKLTTEVRKHLQKCLNEGKGFNPILAIRAETLSSKLKFSSLKL
jgi:DNA-directed RNA polymerase II subunit RPB2